MPTADVRIQEQDGPPVYPELLGKIATHVSDDSRWVLVEKGTEEGAPSVLVAIPLGDYDAGKFVVLELTYALWESIGAVFRGALERWHDEGRL